MLGAPKNVTINSIDWKRTDRTRAGLYLILWQGTDPCVTLLKRRTITTYTASLFTARTFKKLHALSLHSECVATLLDVTHISQGSVHSRKLSRVRVVINPFQSGCPGGYLVERWVRGCAAQIGCFFGLSGLPMAPFLFENWFTLSLPIGCQKVLMHANLHGKKYWLV